MGLSLAHMSKPIKTKNSTDEFGNFVKVGTCFMQGWRDTQEDTFNSCVDYDENTSFFAVYDGHCGHEVATYTAKEFPAFIKQTEHYKKGDIKKALIHGYLGFDAHLVKPETLIKLKEISLIDNAEKLDNDDDDDNDSDDSDDDKKSSTETDSDDDVQNAHEDVKDDDDDDDDDDQYKVEVDETIEKRVLRKRPGYISGCTAVVAILRGNDLYVANAGDCRCVLYRDGKAMNLSVDHKPFKKIEKARIEKAGGHVGLDRRVNGGLNLSRALGDHYYKINTDLSLKKQMVTALPDVRHIVIDPKRDSFMILASDGIWEQKSSRKVVKFINERINSEKKLSEICEELFDACLSSSSLDSCGKDNMTAVLIKFESPSSINESNVADNDENTSIKRSASSDTSIDQINSTGDDEKPVDTFKRMKNETA